MSKQNVTHNHTHEYHCAICCPQRPAHEAAEQKKHEEFQAKFNADHEERMAKIGNPFADDEKEKSNLRQALELAGKTAAVFALAFIVGAGLKLGWISL